MRTVALGLQGGGSHGAFTWGVLDRLLDEMERGRLAVSAVSGASAGAVNAVVLACALAEGGPALAHQRLAEAWRGIAQQGAIGGNALFYNSPGPWGFNIDWSPGAIALEALGLVVSPYTNPFYRDTLGPLLAELLPPERLRFLNAAEAPRVFLTATDVAAGQRAVFAQPDLSVDAVRASACLPSEFKAVRIGDATLWDGGYLGNPALNPLLDHAADLIVVLANPLERTAGIPPTSARAILDRLNEITFNASVVLEMNSIAAINSLLKDLDAQGVEYRGKYRHIDLHLIRDDAFLASLGTVSKSSTSWPLLERLHAAGHAAADRFLAEATPGDAVRDVVRPLLKGQPPPG